MISFKKVLVGIAIHEKDQKIIAYLDFLGQILGIEEICNFHSFVVNTLYQDLNLHTEEEKDRLIELIEKRLNTKVKNRYLEVP